MYKADNGTVADGVPQEEEVPTICGVYGKEGEFASEVVPHDIILSETNFVVKLKRLSFDIIFSWI